MLDVGCGSGYFLHRLREYGAGEAHGIDLMEDRVAEGRERYPALQLQVGSATELPFADGEFDLVTQFTCLSSILDDDVRLAVAREMRRVSPAAGCSRSTCAASAGRDRSQAGGTPTVDLDEQELRRLFGEPALLRKASLAFELSQLTGRHDLLARALGAFPPLRSHLLGLWRAA